MILYDMNSQVAGFDLTGDPFIDSLYAPEAEYRTKFAKVSGGTTTVSYSFPFQKGARSQFSADYGDEPTASEHFGLSTGASLQIRYAFERWADVANLSFFQWNESDSSAFVGDIRIAFSSAVPSEFWGYTKIVTGGKDPSHGDIWIEPSIASGTFRPGSYNFVAMMHEIGHALGLDHPFEGNIIPAGYDDMRYTIMSYTTPKNVFQFLGSDTDASFVINTPGVYDIAAIQAIYGANMRFHAGNDMYAYAPDNPVYATIWDAGGTDTFDISAFTKTCTVTLVPGTYSLLGYDSTELDPNIGIAFGCTIENVNGGSGDDSITGNAAINQLRGNDGNDTINGEGGNDLIEGGAGNDSFNGGDGVDTVSYLSAKAGVTVDLTAGTARATQAGDAARIGRDTLAAIESINGSAFADMLIGSAGNNTLLGGLGDDRIVGNGGVDTASYATAKAGVTVNLALTTAQTTVGAGKDTISSVENLTGSVFNDTLTGSNGANTLIGGKGADAMAGGLGNDTYSVDNAADVVTETAEAGRDTVQASLSYTLGANIENLTQIGTAVISGTGNALANALRGNAAANELSGAAGEDQLFGNGGGDTLVGGAGRDQVTGGIGADTFRFANGDFAGLTTATCDLVTDFRHAEGDRVDLQGVDANTSNGAGDDAFAFIGTVAFGQIAGQIRLASEAGSTILQGDTNGDGTADFWIRFGGAPDLVAADFVL